jgi:DNA-binding transcriptional LysR family regulator
VIKAHPMADLLPGGQFHEQWLDWLSSESLRPMVVTRVSSFTQLAGLVHHAGLAAVLPEFAAVEFEASRIVSARLPWSHERPMVLIGNARSLDRAGLPAKCPALLAQILTWRSDHS